VLPLLKMNEAEVADETLLAWIEGSMSGALTLDGVAVQRVDAAELPARFGYVSEPTAPAQ